MPVYTITSTVPTIFTYKVEADTIREAMRMIEMDEVDHIDKVTDYDLSELEATQIDGETIPYNHTEG